MCQSIKAIIVRACLNIMFMEYSSNESEYNLNEFEKIKNEIILSFDNIKNNTRTFRFNSFKIYMILRMNYFQYVYPKYSNFLEEFKIILKFENNNLFIQEFKNNIGTCDELFVLFLIKIIINDFKI